MSLTTKQQDFIKRKENVLSVEKTIELTEKEIKELIKKQAISSNTLEQVEIDKIIELKTSLLSGLIIIWSESLIKWLLYEHGAFETAQINTLLKNVNSQQWTGAITTAFWKAFSNIPYDPNKPIAKKRWIDNSNQISNKDKERFNKLYKLIELKLDPSIIIRNKIQHGEWIHSYKENGQSNKIEYSNSISSDVQNENILTLKLKRNQFKKIYQIIYDLAVFRNTGNFKLNNNETPFLFYFNQRYRQVLANQNEIDNADYPSYKQKLINSTKRGETWRKKNKFRKVFRQLIRKLK
ncbi:hypothetical protein LNJ08_12245 [Tenacibaculum finnmarkense genomovar ulcerans]|uniref:hypothetical protein n=1 Tax=Tenacibaculum finnmarkense TaxID=2781243 RepID=UPI001E4249B2|nr:hypothetical protein [Tenacibaculum finnmarkense]MCD8455160.1 hypothetical protein [Tenacibaculum finnmarkense genomovar ulcerans]